MKRFFTAVALALCFQASADSTTLVAVQDGAEAGRPNEPVPAATSLLAGTYVSNDHSKARLVIDDSLRITRHRIALRMTTTGDEYAVRFPHRLKASPEQANLYTTRGTVVVPLWNGFQYVECEYRVTLELDAYEDGKGIDATLSYPKTVHAHPQLGCQQSGKQTSPFSYRKVE